METYRIRAIEKSPEVDVAEYVGAGLDFTDDAFPAFLSVIFKRHPRVWDATDFAWSVNTDTITGEVTITVTFTDPSDGLPKQAELACSANLLYVAHSTDAHPYGLTMSRREFNSRYALVPPITITPRP